MDNTRKTKNKMILSNCLLLPIILTVSLYAWKIRKFENLYILCINKWCMHTSTNASTLYQKWATYIVLIKNQTPREMHVVRNFRLFFSFVCSYCICHQPKKVFNHFGSSIILLYLSLYIRAAWRTLHLATAATTTTKNSNCTKCFAQAN